MFSLNGFERRHPSDARFVDLAAGIEQAAACRRRLEVGLAVLDSKIRGVQCALPDAIKRLAFIDTDTGLSRCYVCRDGRQYKTGLQNLTMSQLYFISDHWVLLDNATKCPDLLTNLCATLRFLKHVGRILSGMERVKGGVAAYTAPSSNLPNLRGIKTVVKMITDAMCTSPETVADGPWRERAERASLDFEQYVKRLLCKHSALYKEV